MRSSGARSSVGLYYGRRGMTGGPLRLARELAAVIGFVTAVVAFGKLLLSGWSSLESVLLWLGWAYVALLSVFGLAALVWPGQTVKARLQALAAVVFGTGLMWSAAVNDERGTLYVIGAVGLSVGIVAAAAYYLQMRQLAAKSVKTCPDCAEQVKVAAKVCRYCRYRFPVEEEATA